MNIDKTRSVMNPTGLAPVHFSQLKHIARSPKHYQAALDFRYDSPAMVIGRVFHRAVLLGEEPIVYTETTQRRGKVWEAFREEHADVEDILNAREAEHVMGMVEAVRAHDIAWTILRGRGTRHEVEADWDYLGRACAGRLDTIGPDYIADLKTTAQIEPDRFRRQTENLGYHAQMWWYVNAIIESGILKGCREVNLVTVESKKPHDVVVYELQPNALDEGERLVRLWMELLLNCERSGHWPGYGEAVLPLDVYRSVDLDWGESDE